MQLSSASLDSQYSSSFNIQLQNAKIENTCVFDQQKHSHIDFN